MARLPARVAANKRNVANLVALGLIGGGSSAKPVLALPDTVGLVSSFSVLQQQGYTGPAVQVARISDNVKTDIGFDATTRKPAYTVADASGGSAFSRWYDQTAIGHYVENTTQATQPACTANTEINGHRPITIDGDPLAGTKSLRSAGTGFPTNVDRQNMTIYALVYPQKTKENGAFWDLLSAAFDTSYGRLILNSNAPAFDIGGTRRESNQFAPSRPIFITVINEATRSILRVGGRQTIVGTAVASQIIAALQLGAIVGFPAYAGGEWFFGLWTFNVAKSSAQAADFEASVLSQYGFTRETITKLYIQDASSLLSAYRLTKGNTPIAKLGFGKGAAGGRLGWDAYNISLGGTSFDVTLGSNALANIQSIIGYYTGLTQVAVQLDAPSNYIANTTFTDQADAEAKIDTLFDNAFTSGVNTIKGYISAAGALAKIIVPTVLARGGFTAANFKTFAVARWRTRLLAAASSLGLTVIDLTTIPQLQNPADTTVFDGDQIHLINDGSVNYLVPAISAALAA